MNFVGPGIFGFVVHVLSNESNIVKLPAEMHKNNLIYIVTFTFRLVHNIDASE